MVQQLDSTLKQNKSHYHLKCCYRTILSLHLTDRCIFITKLLCCSGKMRGIGSLKMCKTSLLTARTPPASVQRSTVETCPLAVVCVGSFLFLANAFDPIQTCLCSLRSFSHTLSWNGSATFPFSSSAYWQLNVFGRAKNTLSGLTARGVETMSQHWRSWWKYAGSLSHLCLITKAVFSSYQRYLSQESFLMYQMDKKGRNTWTWSCGHIQFHFQHCSRLCCVAFIFNYFQSVKLDTSFNLNIKETKKISAKHSHYWVTILLLL